MKLRVGSLALLLALSTAPAWGQCAMCYSSAKGAANGGQWAITRAVLTLLLPPVGMMLGLVGFAFRYSRNGHGDENAATAPAESENSAAESRV